MKKLGKPSTVVPRYAVGPPCVSLYSFNVPVVPCTFKEYSSYERYSVHIMSHQLVVTLVRIGCKLLYKIGKAHVDPFRKVTIVNVWTQ